jgi:hypothetical protein
MFKVAWLITVFCTATFGGAVTYNYTGNMFVRCNGVSFVNGNCPGNFSSDYDIASFTFSAPLAGNLSSANELSSPNLTAWRIRDALGLAGYSSTDPNAANELVMLSLSTNGSGAIVGWGIQAPVFAPGSGVPYFGMTNPVPIGMGSGLPDADDFVNTANTGYALSSATAGSWTQTLNGFQGGTTAAPVFLLSGSPVAGVAGTISGFGSQDYYGFNWAGGAFSATASITGASGAASYLFTEGLGSSLCSGGASQTLNSGNSFTSTISNANLAPGQYCIGINANNANDPNFSLTFTTPVSGAPEPSGFALLFVGLATIGVLRRAKRVRQHS